MNLLNRLHFSTVIQPEEPRSQAWWDETIGFRETGRTTARNLVRTTRQASE